MIETNITKLEDLQLLNNELSDKIYINDILNYLDLQQVIPTLANIKSKLVNTGTIVIEEYDSFEVCSAFINGRINSIDLNNIIRGRMHLFNIVDITVIINKAGLKIAVKEIDSLKHYVEVVNV